MDITIFPKKLKGIIRAIPSKSQAHRLLICAAFSDVETELVCPSTNQDIEATAACLRALGAIIDRTDFGYRIVPINQIPTTAILDCNESGSTLRFMLPIVGALGVATTFLMSGRLPNRPLSPLWEEMERMGCNLTRPTENTIHLQGKLKAGDFYIDGSVSSQFITGLIFAGALMHETTSIQIKGKLESKPYVDMTQHALSLFGVDTFDFTISGSLPFHSPGKLEVEGDWSNSAFFLAAETLGSDLEVTGLSSTSRQGDSICAKLLNKLTNSSPIVDATDIPDLVPILAVVAGAKHGAVFTNIARLRLKESDRVATVAAMINALGANAQIDDNMLTVSPGAYSSCEIDTAADHRIAMAAAVAATVSNGPVTILDAQCVAKSYPSFWDEYQKLGGVYEQHIR